MTSMSFSDLSTALATVHGHILQADQTWLLPIRDAIPPAVLHDEFLLPLHTAARQQMACLRELSTAASAFAAAGPQWRTEQPGTYSVSCLLSTDISLGAGIVSYLALTATERGPDPAPTLQQAMTSLDTLISTGLRNSLAKANGLGSRDLEPAWPFTANGLGSADLLPARPANPNGLGSADLEPAQAANGLGRRDVEKALPAVSGPATRRIGTSAVTGRPATAAWCGTAGLTGHAAANLRQAAACYDTARQELLGLRLPAGPKQLTAHSHAAFTAAVNRLSDVFAKTACALYLALKYEASG